MYQASFVLLLFINAFNFRLCYLEKKKKTLANLLVVQEKSVWCFCCETRFGKYEKSYMARSEFGYAYYIDLCVDR